jgi:hypothetical protein
MIESKIFKYLLSATAVTALVSARIYPMALPQNPTYPALTFANTGGQKIYDLSGYSNLENPHIQIDAWSTSYDTVKSLAGKVKTAMDAATSFSANLSGDADAYDDEITEAGSQRIYRISQDWSIWNRE